MKQWVRHKRAFYRIERQGRVQPFGRFYSFNCAMDFLKRQLGPEFEALWPQYEIIDDNGIPF